MASLHRSSGSRPDLLPLGGRKNRPLRQAERHFSMWGAWSGAWPEGAHLPGHIGSMGRVLVVDDDSSVREVLGRLLEVEGHTVLEASSGEAAVQQVPEQRPDLILLDIEMSGMGGLDALRYIRQDLYVAHTQVIIVSVRGRPSDQRQAERAVGRARDRLGLS